jgi:copper(I)-binding protein
MKPLLGLVFLLVLGNCAIADELGLVVSNAWVREGPPGVRMMAGYLEIENATQSLRTLRGASSLDFNAVEIHTTMIENGIARMRHVPELAIAPGQSVQLQPGAKHLMLMGPVKALKAGDRVEIELDFGENGALSVQFPVRLAVSER